MEFLTHWFLRPTRVVPRDKMRRRGEQNMRRMKFTLYYSNAPAPKVLTHDQLERLMPVQFSSEDDAVHGAALVIRGGNYPWLIEGPGVRLDATEIGKRCEQIFQLFRR